MANTGDRPIQVGSHYHFSETNPALDFDRGKARGYRLNIPAGTAVRFEPGMVRTVELVELSDEIYFYYSSSITHSGSTIILPLSSVIFVFII